MKKTLLTIRFTALVLLISMCLSSCSYVKTFIHPDDQDPGNNEQDGSGEQTPDAGEGTPDAGEETPGGDDTNVNIKDASEFIELVLNDKDRFTSESPVDEAKAREAMDRVIAKLRENIDVFSVTFPKPGSTDYKYTTQDGINWTSGMMTGMYWMAYEYTGDPVFKDAAMRRMDSYKEQAETGSGLNDHDTGFKYSLSCVAGYKLTGDESMRRAALDAAAVLLDHYDWDNHFIIRSGKRDPNSYNSYRTMVDTMMNIQLFFFAYEETGDQRYYDAAVGHYRTTLTYLVREDGSSYHHYQFDPVTGAPVGGLTWQGNRDESCWSRGHAWLLYGFPLSYAYTGNEDTMTDYGKIASYYLNNLPSDNVPYWDFDFSEGSEEPRDTSASAIAICGFLELCEYLSDGSYEKTIFKNAADAQMNALIDNYQNTREDADGLILGVTYAKPQGQGIGECAIFGDYFYMEALMRYLNPNFVRYW